MLESIARDKVKRNKEYEMETFLSALEKYEIDMALQGQFIDPIKLYHFLDKYCVDRSLGYKSIENDFRQLLEPLLDKWYLHFNDF